MFRSPVRAATLAMAAASLATVAPAGAKDVLFTAGSTSSAFLEAKGFAGWMPLQWVRFQPTDFSTRLHSVAGDASHVYMLERPFTATAGAAPATVAKYDHAGQLVWRHALDRPLDDIAVLDGSLYAVTAETQTGGSIELLRLNSTDGVAQRVLDLGPSTGRSRRLSASAAAGQLALLTGTFPAMPSPSRSPTAESLRVLTPGSTWVAQPPRAVDAVPMKDTSMRSDGSAMVLTHGFFDEPRQETVITFPGGETQGAVSGPAKISQLREAAGDQFEIDFGPGDAAVASLLGQNTGPWFKLLRTGTHQLTSDIRLTNGIVPDATTLANVELLPDVQVPSGTAASLQRAPAGAFAARSLGTLTLTVDTAAMQRGMYEITTPGVAADHQSADTVVRRELTRTSNYLGTFFVDPFDGNYVGNGDWDLYFAGWERSTGSTTFFDASFQIDGGNRVGELTGTETLRQVLSVGTPASTMRLSLDYRNPAAEGAVELIAQLDGVTIARWSGLTPSHTYGHLTIDLTNPALQGLNAADLRFSLATGGHLYLDNISLLSTVPEPAGVAVLATAAVALLARRRRGSCPA